MSSCGADAHKTYLFTGIRGLDWLPRVYSSRQGARRPRDSVGRCDTRGDLAPWEPSFALCLRFFPTAGLLTSGKLNAYPAQRPRAEQGKADRLPASSPVCWWNRLHGGGIRREALL